tara:strand:- start:175 stop:390 length:216 start_codon:yes stop_codon:yes gene_type:complete
MESYDRNSVLEKIYDTKLPSYALWTEDDIGKEDNSTKKNWWKEMEKEYLDNSCQDKSVSDIIVKWLVYYKV